MHYRYDGSYPGLLTLLQRCFAWEESPERIDRACSSQEDLFAAAIEIRTDPADADTLLQRVRRQLGGEVERNLRHAWLSEAAGIELTLYRYLACGWQVGPRLDQLLARSEVATVQRQARRVRREAHRLKGLVRFRRTADDLYYAPLEPDHFVLPLLGNHFAQRLCGERWLLHDRRRGRGVLCDGRDWMPVELELHAEPDLADDEMHWQGLWRQFFRSIAIAQRDNPRQQRQCMPMKYWKYLVEMEQASFRRPAQRPSLVSSTEA